MRAVFSAIWRSLASAVIALASPRRGARRIRRAVPRTGIQLSRKVSEGTGSRPVIAGSLRFEKGESTHFKKLEGEPASRLPLLEPDGPRRFGLNAGGPHYGVPRFTRPQPPSSERQRRRCGFWLSRGTRRDRQ